MPARRPNIVLLVVDSLRHDAIFGRAPGAPRLPFFEAFARESVCFRRAYATECWTLPTHLSMFTGLSPSEHGAHFRTIAYRGPAPTIAELLSEAGYATEVITRNPVFDGTLPGVTRGFQRNTQVLARLSGVNPLALMLAASKPRFRRQIRSSGFFHPLQKESRAFLAAFARSTVPADRDVLACVRERLRDSHRTAQPCFLFANLFDVHAPYPPSEHSIFQAPTSWDGLLDLLLMPTVLPKLGSHRYLEPGFTLSPLARRLLRQRYDDAVVLMDRKLEDFVRAANDEGLLENTVLILVSDHGEAFGEHDLYLHDASVYDVHLRVPLYIRYPGCTAGAVEDVVSTKDLFGVMRGSAAGDPVSGTLLDPSYRAAHSLVEAEHTPYPHLERARPEYRQPLRAAIAADRKMMLRGEDRAVLVHSTEDHGEANGEAVSPREFFRFLTERSWPQAPQAVRA